MGPFGMYPGGANPTQNVPEPAPATDPDTWPRTDLESAAAFEELLNTVRDCEIDWELDNRIRFSLQQR